MSANRYVPAKDFRLGINGAYQKCMSVSFNREASEFDATNNEGATDVTSGLLNAEHDYDILTTSVDADLIVSRDTYVGLSSGIFYDNTVLVERGATGSTWTGSFGVSKIGRKGGSKGNYSVSISGKFSGAVVKTTTGSGGGGTTPPTGTP